MAAATPESTRGFLADVLTVAVECGIGYWARGYEIKRDDDPSWWDEALRERADGYYTNETPDDRP